MSKLRFLGPRNPNFTISTSSENPIWRKSKMATKNGSYIGNFHIISLYVDWIWLVICLTTGGILNLQFQLLQEKSIWRKCKMASKMSPENGISHSNRPNYHYYMGCNMSKPRFSWSGNPNFTISTSLENQYGGNPR